MRLVGVSRTGHFLTLTQRQRDKNLNIVEYYDIIVSKKCQKFINCQKFKNLVCYGGAWAEEREREGWWVSGNWLKVKNKAKNLGNLVILTFLGQIFYNWVK